MNNIAKIDDSTIAGQEKLILEQQLKYKKDMVAAIQSAHSELSDLYIGLINAKDEFEKIKKENIEEIRRYKYAISSEVKEICSDVKRITDSITKDKLADLSLFVDACEKLQALRSTGFFDSVRII